MFMLDHEDMWIINTMKFWKIFILTKMKYWKSSCSQNSLILRLNLVYKNNQISAYDYENNFQILAQVLLDMLSVISLFLGYQQAWN